MRGLLVLAALLIVAACAGPSAPTYRLVPPPDAAAPATAACLARCEQARGTCRDPALADLRRCDEDAVQKEFVCRRRADIAYTLCNQGSGGTGKVCVRRTCFRDACPTTALDDCEATYRSCYASCGGQVVPLP